MSRTRAVADLYHSANAHHSDDATHPTYGGWDYSYSYDISGALDQVGRTYVRVFDYHCFVEMYYTIGGADGTFEMSSIASPRAKSYGRDHSLGTLIAYDASTDTGHAVSVVWDNSANKLRFRTMDTQELLGPGVPFVWAPGDKLTGYLSYRVNFAE